MEHHILANADLVRSIARDSLHVLVEYDETGVRWLETYIDGQRQSASEEVKSNLPSALGSFLGECIRHTFGGQWVQVPEQGWMIKINDRLSVFPFNKVEKQLANEDGESVLGLFTAIPSLLAGIPTDQSVLAPTPEKARPWWKFW